MSNRRDSELETNALKWAVEREFYLDDSYVNAIMELDQMVNSQVLLSKSLFNFFLCKNDSCIFRNVKLQLDPNGRNDPTNKDIFLCPVNGCDCVFDLL